MTPKIDTLNIAYFIPGIVLTVAIALGASEFESPLAGLTKQMSITDGVVFLALSYVVGYAMWALGDIVYRTRSDKWIGTRMLHYICIEKRIRTHFKDMFRDLGLSKLERLLGAESCMLDVLAEETPPPWKTKSERQLRTAKNVKASWPWRVVEFLERIIDCVRRLDRLDRQIRKQRVEKLEQRWIERQDNNQRKLQLGARQLRIRITRLGKAQRKLQLQERELKRRIQKKYFERLGTKITAKYAGRVRTIAWDLIYSRRNEYHIGRFLSSWNNVKFAKATMCSLLLGGTFYLICSVSHNFHGGVSGVKALIIGSYLVFGTAYFWIVKWRLRAFARDLVHGLAPHAENSNSRGLAMTYDDVMKTIRDSEFDDWLLDDEKGIFTLRNDLDVRIERRDPDDVLASYSEPWANNHSDPNATRVYFDIYYRSSFVETFMQVYVDGARACLPYPDTGTTTIPYARYQLARAVDHQDTLDDYIQRSGLTVAKA